MRFRGLAVLFCLSLVALPAIAKDEVSHAVAALYKPAERKRLAYHFVGAVNTFLQRYERKVLVEESNYVKMQVRYDYVYTLELIVRDAQYEIKVTGSDRSRGTASGQRNAVNLANGILERMEAKNKRRDEMKDRWQQSR